MADTPSTADASEPGSRMSPCTRSTPAGVSLPERAMRQQISADRVARGRLRGGMGLVYRGVQPLIRGVSCSKPSSRCSVVRMCMKVLDLCIRFNPA